MKKIAPFLFSLFTILYIFTPSAHADWLIDSSGTLLKISPSILGDSDETVKDTDDKSDDDAKQSDDDQDDDQIDDQNDDEVESPESSSNPADSERTREQEILREQAKQKQEQDKKQAEREREALKKQAEARKELLKKSGNKNEFRIKSEDGKIKVESELKDANGNLIRRTKTEIEDDKERFGIMDEDGKIMEIQEVGEDRLEIMRERIKTKSELELKIGEKNEISVTLPNGKVREVKLPDVALAKLVENGVITETEGEEGSYVLTAGANGEPIFSGVSGEVEKSFLGLKFKFKQKFDVAASDSEDGTVKAGDIIEAKSQETGWRAFLERFAL